MRKYSKCLWCGKTIDITSNDNELCPKCASYPSYNAMIKDNPEIIGKLKFY